jgi:hypothetical protein
MKKMLLSGFFLLCVMYVAAQNGTPYWSLLGNSNASTSSKLGTTNAIPLRFLTQNIERMRVDALGRVGIGTIAPTNKLQVVGTSLFTTTMTISNGGIVAKNTAGTAIDANGSLYGVNSQGGSYGVFGYSLNGKGLFGSSTNNYGVYGVGKIAGVYGTSDNSSGVYGISSNGVGVQGKGTVYGVIGENTSDASANNAGVVGQSTLFSGTGVYGYANGVSGDGVYGYSASHYGIVGASGKPQGFAAFFSGNTYATGTYQGSDSMLKQNIVELSSALDIISKLRPKSYTFRQDDKFNSMLLPDGKHYGLIAQDVEKVLPNLVKTVTFEARMAAPLAINKPGEALMEKVETYSQKDVTFKALNYTELIPIVIKGMQELRARNDQKDSVIKDLQNQINELRSILVKQGNLSIGGFLKQNIPNPVKGTTVISYYLPDQTVMAQIKITDVTGATLKVYTLSRGSGQLTIRNADLPAGTYTYTLFAGLTRIDSKQMVIIK